jgi:hypothetical protein
VQQRFLILACVRSFLIICTIQADLEWFSEIWTSRKKYQKSIILHFCIQSPGEVPARGKFKSHSVVGLFCEYSRRNRRRECVSVCVVCGVKHKPTTLWLLNFPLAGTSPGDWMQKCKIILFWYFFRDVQISLNHSRSAWIVQIIRKLRTQAKIRNLCCTKIIRNMN